MYPYFNMFNEQYILQQAQQHHLEQVYEVQKCVKALHDFLDGLDKIEPGYKQMANEEFCYILLDYFRNHNL